MDDPTTSIRKQTITIYIPMLKLFVFAMILCGNRAASNLTECSMKDDYDDCVHRVTFGDYPHQVQLFHYLSVVCTGTIISNSHIITAAACVDMYLHLPYARYGELNIAPFTEMQSDRTPL